MPDRDGTQRGQDPGQFAVRDTRRVGWYSVDNEIIDEHGALPGAYGVAVYNVLCRHARNQPKVTLSVREIGAALGISHDRVRKSLVDLAVAGLVHHEPPRQPGPGRISAIVLLNVKGNWTPHVQTIRK